jgi:rubrerythrin
VDLESAEPATSRRSLIATLGVAGLAGAAALAGARPASAAPYSPTATASDTALLDPAMRLELAARRLYLDAAQVLGGDAKFVAETFAGNHMAYADSFAAATGNSADAIDEAFYEENAQAFTTSDVVAFAEAAWAMENSFAATYTEMSRDLEAVQSRTTVAAIVVINARMATVLADLAGVSDDLDLVLEPPAEPFTLEEVVA